MSIQTEITRLQELKADLRTKLVSMVGAPSTATLEQCVDAVEGIAENGAVEGTITTKSGKYDIPAGHHNGSGKVQISAGEQAKLIPGNIKAGVTILGVDGDCKPATDVKIQPVKSVTPTKSPQNVRPDAGYDVMSGVDVGAIPGAYQDVSQVDATAEKVLTGFKIVTPDGKLTAGTMPDNGAPKLTIDGLTAVSASIPAGYSSGGSVTLTNAIENALAAI